MRTVKLLTKTVAMGTVLVLLFGAFGISQKTPVVHAAVICKQGDTFSSFPDGTNCSTAAIGSTQASPDEAAAYTKDVKNAADLARSKKAEANPYETNNICSRTASCLAWVIYWIGPGFASWVTGIAAYFLDYIVKISLNSTAYALGFLTTGWSLVLNLANMFFIFILIYTAFIIMLKAETSRTMQTLAWVIAIALVVNFSFFFTRVIIDAGNILGTQFYNGITEQVGDTRITTKESDPKAPVDITIGIMRSVGISNILDSSGFDRARAAIGSGTSELGTLLVLTVVFISTAVMCWMLTLGFFMIAVKFLIRVVGLWFVLIASPLGFVSKTLPKTQHFFEMWLRALVSLSFYPAIFLFMFYVLNMFVSNLASDAIFAALSNQSQAAAGAAAPLPLMAQLANVFIRMGFIIVMTYLMLKVADWVMEQSGGLAATMVNRIGSGLVGAGFRTAAGTAGWTARQTVGRGAQRLSESNWLRDKAKDNVLARTLWRGTGVLGRSTLDVRNAPGGGLLNKALGSIAGGPISVGKASSATFATSDKERAERKKEEGERLKASKANIEKAQEAEIKKLSEQSKQELADAAKAYDNAKKRVDEVGDAASRQELKAAKNNFDRLMKPINNEVEKKTGAGNADAYAQNITSKRLWNLGLPSKAAYEAAAKLRDTKNKGGGVLATLKKVSGTTPSATVAPPGWTVDIATGFPVAPGPAPLIPPVIGPGGSAFDQRTAAQKIASEPNPERRAMLEENLRAMQEQGRAIIQATEGQQRATEKLSGSIEKLAQKPVFAQGQPAAKAAPLWKAGGDKPMTVTLDEKSMRRLRELSKEIKSGFGNLAHGQNPEEKPAVESEKAPGAGEPGERT